MAVVTEDQVRGALEHVMDPEIKRPITELGMVESVTILETEIIVGLLLTVAGCSLKDTLHRYITQAVGTVAPAHAVLADMGVMYDAQRADMRNMLRGGAAERE